MPGNEPGQGGGGESDVLLYTGVARVDWVFVSAGTTGGTWELNDSTDDSGTDLIGGFAPANTATPIHFPKGLWFHTGIFLDMQTSTNVHVYVGYAQ